MLWYASAVLGAVAVVSKMAGGRWLAPGTLLPLLWAALIAYAHNFNVGGGIWTIVLLVGAFSFGQVLISRPQPKAAGTRSISQSQLRALRYAYNIVTFIGVVGVGLVVIEGLHKFGLGYSPRAISHLGNAYSKARYATPGTTIGATGGISSVLAMLAGLSFAGSALAGFRFCFIKRRLPLLIAPAAALIFAYSTAEHAFLLYLGAFTVSGWIVAMTYKHPTRQPVKFRQVLVVALAIVLLPAALGYLTKVRHDYTSSPNSNQGVQTYIIGSIPAFTAWQSSAPHVGLGLGVNTFAGPASLLHIRSRGQGLYDQFVSIETNGSSTTNVYTAFRPLIQDFGLPVSTLLMFLLGAWAALLYKRVNEANRTRSWGALTAFYVGIFTSSVVSLFAYNNVTFDVVVIMVLAHSLPRMGQVFERRERARQAAIEAIKRARQPIVSRAR